jgi:ElaB/YqjD/DUF883 family membrane-anchored ribosome-binding protein
MALESVGKTDSTGEVTSKVASASNTAASTAHGAVDKAGKAADQALDKAKSTAEHVRDAAHGAVDRAVGATTPAAKWIEQKELYAREKEQALVKATSEFVAASPVKALAISFVAGLLIGRILL